MIIKVFFNNDKEKEKIAFNLDWWYYFETYGSNLSWDLESNYFTISGSAVCEGMVNEFTSRGLTVIKNKTKTVLASVNKPKSNKLRKCPFCGSKAVCEYQDDDHGWFIGCVLNVCEVKPSFWHDDKDMAIRIWNGDFS